VVVPAFFGGAFLATVAQTGALTATGRMQTTAAERNVLLICLPFAFAIGLSAPTVIEVFAGSDYDQAATALAILAPMIALVGSYAVLSNLQVAAGRIAPLVWINVAGVVIKAGLNLWTIPAYGVEGAAAAAVAAEAVVVVAQTWSARALVDMRDVLSVVGRLLACGAAMVAVGVAVASVSVWPLGLAAGLAVFVVAGHLTRSISVDELRLAASHLKP
jgi:O-antigen/teichoic acid export membrane protein